MVTWYTVLKVVHVLSVVAWIGAATAFTSVTALLLGARERDTIRKLFPYTMRYGQRVAAPSSLIVLLTGVAMVLVGRLPFDALWVRWGLAGILLHFIYGATVMRKRAMAFVPLLSSTPADDAKIAVAGRRLVQGNFIYVLLMASVIVVMVLKPTF